MSTRKLLVVTAVLVVGTLLATASVAGAVYLGLKTTTPTGAAQTGVPTSTMPGVTAARGTDVATPGTASTYFNPGPFEPGQPAGLGLSGDGIITSGVAFKETTDANAQVDAELVKSAYQDAQKKAQALASATGLKLGSLLAVTDYTQNQPYFKPCFGPPLNPTKPGGAPGSGGSATSGPPAIAQPAPAPCNGTRFLVVWVTVRYQVAG